MLARIVKLGAPALFGVALMVIPLATVQAAEEDGIVRIRSAYPFAETIARLKKDIADKGIKFFSETDQAQLAADAGIKLHPSTLLVFGNPPLGTQFMTSNANSGLDWPVRLLVVQDEKGEVWTVYTDFGWIARRHQITDREAQFKMASKRDRLHYFEREVEIAASRSRPAPEKSPPKPQPESVASFSRCADEVRT